MNLEKVHQNLYKVALREKIFQGDISWGVAPKIDYFFEPGEVVEYTGYTVITTYDGAFSTYLKPGQLGVIINPIQFGQAYLVSWEIGGGYMMTFPVRKENIKEVPPDVKKKKIEIDKRKDDILTQLVAPEHDITEQSKKETENEFRAEPFGNPEAKIEPPGVDPNDDTGFGHIHFNPMNKVPAMRYKRASKELINLKKILNLLPENKEITKLIASVILQKEII